MESKSSNPKRVRCGRPEDLVKPASFIRVADYLVKNDDKQIIINDLKRCVNLWKKIMSHIYSLPHMRHQIQKHFGDQIIITEINGKSNVVTFRSTASKILHDFSEQSSRDCGTENVRIIIETATKL